MPNLITRSSTRRPSVSQIPHGETSPVGRIPCGMPLQGPAAARTGRAVCHKDFANNRTRDRHIAQYHPDAPITRDDAVRPVGRYDFGNRDVESPNCPLCSCPENSLGHSRNCQGAVRLLATQEAQTATPSSSGSPLVTVEPDVASSSF